MVKKLRVSDIFFDLDHTLWDFDKNSGLALQNLFEKFKIPISLEAFLPVYETINQQYWKLYREDKISKTELRRGRLKDAFFPFQLQFPVEFLDEFAEDYIQLLPSNNYLMDGAFEILDYLAPNYQLHIITNGFEEVQHQKMKNSGLEKYFKTITTSEKVGVKKPDSKIFEEALFYANAKATSSAMIGDNFEADILGANAMEMHTIFFDTKRGNIKHPCRIKSLNEIKKFL